MAQAIRFVVKDASGRKIAGPFSHAQSATDRARDISKRKGGGWHVYRWRIGDRGIDEGHMVTFVGGRRV